MKKQKAYQKNLKLVGTVLFVIGVLDIFWMLYCILSQRNYSSMFNIFAVFAGLLLIAGGLRTAVTVAWLCASFLTYYVGTFLFLPFTTPLDLIFIQWKL